MSSNEQSAVNTDIDQTNTEINSCAQNPTDSPHLNLTRIELDGINNLEGGDHITWKRTYGLYHHAIVHKVNAEQKTLTVIHLAKEKVSSKIIVHDEEIVCEEANGVLYKINYKDNERLRLETTLKLAKPMIGKQFRSKSYCPLTNNCEHFATYCTTGRAISHQANELKRQVDNSKGRALLASHLDAQYALTKTKQEPKQYDHIGDKTGEIQANHVNENASVKQIGTDEMFSSGHNQNYPADSISSSVALLANTLTEKRINIEVYKAIPHVINGTVASGASILMNKVLSNKTELSAQPNVENLSTVVNNATQNVANSVAKNTIASGVNGSSNQIVKEVVLATAKQTVSTGIQAVVKKTFTEEIRPTVIQTLSNIVNGARKIAAKVSTIINKIPEQSPTTVTRAELTQTVSVVTHKVTETIGSSGVKQIAIETSKTVTCKTAECTATVSNSVKKVIAKNTEKVKSLSVKKTMNPSLVSQQTAATEIEVVKVVTKQTTETVTSEQVKKGGIPNTTLIIFGVEALSTAYDIYGLYKRKQGSDITNKVFVENATERVIAGLSGVVGSLACSKLGATIGTIIYPGTGTAIGAYAGSVVGNLVARRFGMCGGSAIGKWLSNWWS